MLKKTLLALAVASVATSASAMTLDVDKNIAGDAFSVNVLASQTKQSVLDKTSLEAVLNVKFVNSAVADADELRNAGEIILQLDGDAQFNETQIADWLTSPVTDDGAIPPVDTTAFPGIALDLAGAGTYSSDRADLAKVFKITDDGTNATISYTLDEGNKRLSLRLADTLDVSVANEADIDLRFDFFDNQMKQGFKLISGTTSQVKMNIGALENASYTADPQSTVALFKTDNLFKVEQTALANGKDATALVSSTYTQWETADADNYGIIRGVKFFNNTTKQNIQHKHVKLSLVGDFSGIATKNGKLADENGVATVWSVADGKATVTYSAVTTDSGLFAGNDNDPVYAGEAITLPKLIIDEANTVSIPAQKFALQVETVDNATFVPYVQNIGDAFVVVRDGMKFDTVTTGTSSSNVIYIRDVSKTLPADGGKIFVTITEYDAHDLENGGKGTDLVTRAELPVRLPSNGAVTLTPAGIAAALGVESTPARQARFYFEVETNEGEAAVKKQTAEGVDIQTGSIATVDFTL
ncbi:S-layer protein [Vibrio vulnificus]|uniref:S-layer protein n=2 Tax=Vibrio vulnificus TaxID=672 RepID=A0A2S3R5X2_VIBVL|nr:S-layer protein [Vibrio vulnificus]POB49110.1 S-layer protein [Vibrio vulnificus]